MAKPLPLALGTFAAIAFAAITFLSQPGIKDAVPTSGSTSTQPSAAQQPSRSASPPPPATDTIRYGEKKARPKAPGTIRITTFNIENLFDDKDDPTLTGSGDDKDMTKPLADMQAAAAAINAVDADILCFQEVESEEALRWFRDNHLAGLGYDHLVSVDAGDPRGIEQSVLSRFPVKDVKTYVRKKIGGTQPEKWGNQPNPESGQPFEFKRTPLQFTVTIPSATVTELLKKAGQTSALAKDYELTIFNVHLKSGRDYDAQRGAEAGGIVELVKAFEKAKPSANILVVGDFNATLNQPSLQVFNQAGIISIWNDRNPRDTATMTHASGRCIDHIYYTRNSKPELLLDTRFVLGLPARPAGSDWRTTPAPTGYASDHYPVSVDLRPFDR